MVFDEVPFGAFATSAKITRRGDIIAVPTPGHTAGHLAIIVLDGDVQVMLAGDVTYSENALLHRRLEGISFAKAAHLPTIDTVRRHATMNPTVFLPSHDQESPARLDARQVTHVE